ncbi:hypothetical protein D9Q98_007829 [Chlorella vulgaris]|uniref:Phosphoglycerate mutase n=1 Tax=Chlorella vulgaris TaxID=3077 RepID=A0A9D4THN9_CHLVU|nr:hypothetical protein D9Q98_007829 [Chlorella vulgaris]
MHSLKLSFKPASVLNSAPSSRLSARRQGLRVCCQASQTQQQIRRLVLMRHADSEASSGRDHDREITLQGAQEARLVGEQLRATGWLPQVVICSNAQRTRQTLDVLQKTIPELGDADQHFLGSLYTTAALDGQTRGHLAELVAAEAAHFHDCCLCLGHNKGWEEAASAFAGVTVRLGNAHAALLEAHGASWAEALAEGTKWRLVQVLQPPATA